jgi:hypothetical protein
MVQTVPVRDTHTGRPGANAPAASQEYLLLDYADRLSRHRENRLALHIHLSRLQQQNRREHHIRVAISTFEELVKQFEGAIFHLLNHDIVFVCKGAQPEDLEQAVLKLRYLFSEDPLTRFADDHTDGGFCTWYVLESDYDRFQAMAKRFYELSQAHTQESRRLRDAMARPQAFRQRPAMTPDDLSRVEQAIGNADLSSLVRHQPVCAVTRDTKPMAIFHEMYVSIGDLENQLLPKSSMTGSPWLFQHLTQALDRRMLTQVLRDHANSERPFSLNLNVSTILSDDFRKFDQGIGLGVRGRLVIELQKVDIFADMGAYLFARDFLRERGYRICLDGLTHLVLPYIDRDRLGIDLLKMYWSDELMSGMRPESLDDLKATIRRAGQARMILTRCDHADAIALGQKLGISLFQGRQVDALINNDRPVSRKQGSARFD